MKLISNILFIAIAMLGSASASEKSVHWGYQGAEGPEHWGELSPDFSLCADGRNQSPVDLTADFDLELPELLFQYHGTPVRELNNGHTIMLQVRPGNYLEIPELDQRFNFKQAHFHSPSEHTVDGRSFAMEVHLVHANEDGELAVVGIMFEEGAEDFMLNRIWSFMPENEGETTESPLTVFEAGVLPPTREYFRYNGSLTTPPCSEGVTWMILKQHMTASADQISRFQQRIGSLTNRPVQPHNARLILN